MHTSTHVSRHGWKSLLYSLAFLLISFGGITETASAQTVCDMLGVAARTNDSCCFQFVLENGQRAETITKVTMRVDGATFSDVGSPNDATVTSESRAATWTFRNGVPQRTDGLSACFTPNSATGKIWVVVQWVNNNNSVICADTLELECKTQEEDCLQIVEQEIECNTEVAGPQNVWSWNFNIKNKSRFYATAYELRVLTQGVSVSPTTGSVNGTVAPNGVFPRSNITITGGQPGQTVRILVKICGSTTPETDDWICCEEIIEIKLPECKTGCFEIVEQDIKCKPGQQGNLAYEWCFSFRNQSNLTINRVYVNNQYYAVSPVAPGTVGTVCVMLNGSPGQTAVVLNLCQYDSVFVQDTIRGGAGRWDVERIGCCEKRVELTLPKCGEDECFELVNQEIVCDSSGYLWCFNVRNHADWTSGSISLSALSNVNSIPTITPGTITFQTPVGPGGLSERICVRITNAVPGRILVPIQNCADRIRICCSDTIELILPECKPHGKDCCDGFQIGLANIAPVAAPNGLTGLLGAISAGPSNIAKVSATIVSSTVNGQPAFGYFNSGVILNPLGAGTVTPPPFGQELIWNAPGGVNMNAPALTLEWLRFPPMAPNARTDVLEFCIRWRFTDNECRTCDTLVCYRVVRRQSFLSQAKDEKSPSIQGGNSFVNGELTGQNSATLSITLPALPEGDFGTVTYTGITLQADEGVQISNVAAGNTTFSTEHGLAIANISAQAGEKFDLQITYSNLNNRPSLGHFLLLGYESSLMPGIQQQLPLSVTLRQAGTETGGDKVNAVRTEIEGARVETFALHLKNANNTNEPLAGLRIKAGSGVKLLAVGPTSSDEEALLRFGAASESGRTYISEASEGTMQLAPGAERNPIYLTVSYNGELSPVVHYETLNGLDDVVSEGDVDLTQVSSVHDGGVAGTSISLGQSHPNPATGQATISLRLSERERVNLVLRDARGKEVASLLEGEVLESGVHVVNVSVSDLANGVYFYTLETPTGTETRKLVVQK